MWILKLLIDLYLIMTILNLMVILKVTSYSGRLKKTLIPLITFLVEKRIS